MQTHSTGPPGSREDLKLYRSSQHDVTTDISMSPNHTDRLHGISSQQSVNQEPKFIAEPDVVLVIVNMSSVYQYQYAHFLLSAGQTLVSRCQY